MHTGRRLMLIVACSMILVMMAGIIAVSAQRPMGADMSESRVAMQGTVTVPTPDNRLALRPPECHVSCDLSGGPEPFCPGWNLWYTLLITNTGEFPVTNLVISDSLPSGVWLAEDGGNGTVQGSYDEATNAMWWNIPLLDVDETAVISCVLRTYSSVPSGAVVENTFQGNGFNLTTPISESLALVADSARCAQPMPTSSPTSAPTPIGHVPTPEPPADVFAVCMPVIVH